MRVTLIVSCLLVAMLAGCIQDAEPTSTSESPATTSMSQTSTEPANETNTSAPIEPNNPPSANLSHDLENDSVAVNATVNFTIEASDPDGDNLTWELDVDGDEAADYNGTDTDVGSVSHNYTENGTYNVTLVVSDGELEANATIQVNVTGGAAGATFEDSVFLPCPTCPDVVTDSVEFELTPDLVGLPFTANSTKGDPDLVFTSEDCDGDVVDTVANPGPEEGTVPEGAACMIAWEFLDPDSDITVVIGTPPVEEEEP